MSLRAQRACLHAGVPLHIGAFVQEGVTARRRGNPPHPLPPPRGGRVGRGCFVATTPRNDLLGIM